MTEESRSVKLKKIQNRSDDARISYIKKTQNIINISDNATINYTKPHLTEQNRSVEFKNRSDISEKA